MLMIMAEDAVMKKPEEALRQQPQAKETAPGVADMMARLREARISKAEPKVSEDTRSKLLQSFCTEFFTACYDKAKKEGTTNAFNGSEMKQCFG
jgi:hypothetical protein